MLREEPTQRECLVSECVMKEWSQWRGVGVLEEEVIGGQYPLKPLSLTKREFHYVIGEPNPSQYFGFATEQKLAFDHPFPGLPI